MGLFSKLLKGGIATAVINQARKPENQAKAKRAFENFRNKGGGSAGQSGRHGTS